MNDKLNSEFLAHKMYFEPEKIRFANISINCLTSVIFVVTPGLIETGSYHP